MAEKAKTKSSPQAWKVTLQFGDDRSPHYSQRRFQVLADWWEYDEGRFIVFVAGGRSVAAFPAEKIEAIIKVGDGTPPRRRRAVGAGHP